MAVQRANVVVQGWRRCATLANHLYVHSPIITLENSSNCLELGVVINYPGNAGPSVLFSFQTVLKINKVLVPGFTGPSRTTVNPTLVCQVSLPIGARLIPLDFYHFVDSLLSLTLVVVS